MKTEWQVDLEEIHAEYCQQCQESNNQIIEQILDEMIGDEDEQWCFEKNVDHSWFFQFCRENPENAYEKAFRIFMRKFAADDARDNPGWKVEPTYLEFIKGKRNDD